MPNLKLRKISEPPVALDHRSIILVGSGNNVEIYIGNSDNEPVPISTQADPFREFLFGNTVFDENEDMGFDLDENTLNVMIKE